MEGDLEGTEIPPPRTLGSLLKRLRDVNVENPADPKTTKDIRVTAVASELFLTFQRHGFQDKTFDRSRILRAFSEKKAPQKKRSSLEFTIFGGICVTADPKVEVKPIRTKKGKAHGIEKKNSKPREKKFRNLSAAQRSILKECLLNIYVGNISQGPPPPPMTTTSDIPVVPVVHSGPPLPGGQPRSSVTPQTRARGPIPPAPPRLPEGRSGSPVRVNVRRRPRRVPSVVPLVPPMPLGLDIPPVPAPAVPPAPPHLPVPPPPPPPPRRISRQGGRIPRGN